MQDYQKRVVQEKTELDEKLTKLRSFLGCTASAQILDAKGLRLLQQQERVMAEYSTILGKRIESFK